MTVTDLASLLGGLGLFLLGMWMMTDGLKLAAGSALKSILETWTSSAARGFMTGVLITAIVQSSSAVTVAAVGFVNAGLLTLKQALWVVIGTNVGTTMTGWLVALVGVKVEVGALALPLIGIGMLLRMAARGRVELAGAGQALAGFGAFFLGISVLQDGFAGMSGRITELNLEHYDWSTIAAFFGLGALLTVMTQSSSAAIALTLTASATGGVPLPLAAAAVVGTNVGTTSTALFAALNATPPARRVASAHILFNVMTGVVAMALLQPLLFACRLVAGWTGAGDDVPTTLALFHTGFNLLGAALMWPAGERIVRQLERLYVSAAEKLAQPRFLDATLIGVPTLALRGLVLELERMTDIAFRAARVRIAAMPGAHAMPTGERDALAQLARQARSFIGRLSGNPLPEDVVAALPDLIRATQHLDDLGALTPGLAAAPPRADIAMRNEWQELRAAALHSLEMRSGVEAASFDDEIRRVDTAYQRVKADLLRTCAAGLLPVEAMEDALDQARTLRRSADVAIKARRRLSAWVERVGAHPQDGAEAPAGDGTRH
ncbi:MAG: Na/Pi cotransporter family protein [Alphaproteobacteria bacterium]|nr:Na/Pi cotransporter family protein [Alphaproteobacteria bacterium]MCW5742839.1 Na/Pi cotransporter family protein [Alphaproteobacteria bacterium]